MDAAACPAWAPISSTAASAANLRPRPTSTRAQTAATRPTAKSGYVHPVTRSLKPAPAASSTRTATPPSSARRPGQPYETETQAAITTSPASTNVCRYGLPLGVAKACHSRCVGSHCNDSATPATSPAHAHRSRPGTDRWKASAQASSRVPVPRKSAGVKKLYVAGSSRASTSGQAAGANARSQPG